MFLIITFILKPISIIQE